MLILSTAAPTARELVAAMRELAAATHHLAAQSAGEPLAFYTVAAGLIPVLYIALAWQAQVWRGPPSDDSGGAIQERGVFSRLEGARYMALVAVIGEVTALDVLARDRPSDHALHVVSVVLVALTSPLIMAVLRPLALRADHKRIEHDGIAFESVALTIVGLLVTTAAILAAAGLRP